MEKLSLLAAFGNLCLIFRKKQNLPTRKDLRRFSSFISQAFLDQVLTGRRILIVKGDAFRKSPGCNSPFSIVAVSRGIL